MKNIKTKTITGGAYLAPSCEFLNLSQDNVLCESAVGNAEDFTIDEDYVW